MSAILPPASMPRLPRVSRNVTIGATVVGLHVVGLYAMNSGLLRRVVEVIVPVEIVSQVITPPAPQVEQPKPVPAPPPPPKPVVKQERRTPPPAPRPVAVAPSPIPAPAAPVGVTEPQPPAPPITAPVTAAPPAPAVPPAPPAPPRVELPSSDAEYLRNPQPVYPPMSKRLGETGQVMLHVRIGADGLPKEAKVSKSSGYDRLDSTARETVMKWRFVPGKRNGTPEEMWYFVPMNFVLD